MAGGPRAGRGGVWLITVCLAAGAAGCGETERSGAIGDTLTAKGLEVTVFRVDRRVPTPRYDVTGLSQPAPGFKLVGVRVRVCSDHGGATGPYHFGVEASGGRDGRLKFPQRNYADSFDSLRDGCGSGWVVLEIPRASRPERVTYGFEDTGSYRREHTRVDARFSWSVEA